MLNYKVPEMSCGHCVKTITEAITGVDPSATVKSDLDKGEIRVESRADASKIGTAIKEAGYENQQIAA